MRALQVAVALLATSAAGPASSQAPAEKYVKPPPAELRKKLSSVEYWVTQQAGTEPAFTGALWNHKEPGLYVDVVTGEPLFSSLDKFDSGTGWPSFTRPVEEGRVVEKKDSSHGMERVEVKSRSGDSHLGHVFDDGPQDKGGLRYCINSASLRFVPASKLEAEGYGRFAKLFAQAAPVLAPVGAEVALLAGGCFWGMEEILRKVPGVLATEVGYTGGHLKNPKYEDTHDSKSGHAEAVKVTFDPKKLSYAELLEKWFFRMHDPTTLNRQGNDVGTQYRSAIFYSTEAQRKTALEVKARVDKAGKWKKPIVTEVVAASTWWPAEDYHQDYLVKNPRGYTCHYLRD